ncbi:MAG TPA: hypothetical protein PLY90_11385 [Candidatus Hydrogenedentes bacterium]|jgi:hypothetical protein|nr:MAG: hypothetical protein BWY07_00996 [Candidatus Hydrogenedentes bacterium ADurb.Bin170]HNZ49233.1 hypothetical protein [Candidatus Hydrogenedentota bacterium]HOD94231.1 hypothetical protein [Candidatus Hydrogenedentota bacterium]HOR49638.1 hypothetical protein [Candidatus Hydrogenedentota bacterium]HPK23611.1 hypothetical protein [Candidatus Hydrogenedentota bacterium]
MKQNPILWLLILLPAALSGCSGVCANDDDEQDRTVTITAMEDTLGYTLSAPFYQFSGTLTKESSKDPWKLKADFYLPNSGCYVSDPEILIAESYPEQVKITLTVNPAPPGMIILPAFFVKSAEAEIQASDEAVFSVVLVDKIRRHHDDLKRRLPAPPGAPNQQPRRPAPKPVPPKLPPGAYTPQ